MSTPPLVYPGPDTFPGTDPGTRVHEQLRVHLVTPGVEAVGQDVSARLLSAGIERGGDASQTVLRPSAGTVNLSLDGDLAGTLSPGRYLAVVHHDGTRLVTAKVTEAVVTDERVPGRRPRTVTTVRAGDAVTELANTKRYSVAAGSAEGLEDRLARLMASAPHVPYRIRGTHDDAEHVRHRVYVHESDLAKHLTLLADGSILGWFVDIHGVVTFAPATARAFSGGLTPTTEHYLDDGSAPPSGWDDELAGRPSTSPVRITRGLSLADHANVVTVRRYARTSEPDEDGNHQQRILTYGPIMDAEAANSWGRRELTVDTTVTNLPEAPRPVDQVLAEHYATLRPPHHRPRAVRLNAGRHGWPGYEVLDVLDVLSDSRVHRLYVASIRHTITATSWLVDIELGDTGSRTWPPTPTPPPVIEPVTPGENGRDTNPHQGDEDA